MLEFSGFSSDIDQLSLTSTFHSVKQDGVLNMRACYSNDQTTFNKEYCGGKNKDMRGTHWAMKYIR